MKKWIYSMIASILWLKGAIAMEETAKYENYLNGLTTLSGNFTQTNSRGQTSSGTIQISRPGKMRLTYNPPSGLLIVADGKWLITKDRIADEVDYVSLENTPAAFILRPQIRFGGDVAVTNIIPKDDNTTEVSLVRRDDQDAGYITLIFEDDPVSLKAWSVVDAQGVETRVTLSDVQANIPLSPGLFRIKSPNLFQQIF